jgi:type IV pilus assembly protein PilX
VNSLNSAMRNIQPASKLPGRRAQSGAILIFCLVFLLILTTMGVASMESTILEERMAGNMQDHTAAFQAAESSLQAAESWLVSQTIWPTTSADGTTTVWTLDAMDPDSADAMHWWEDSDRQAEAWWAGNAEAVAGVDGLASLPRYMVEELANINAGQSLAIGTGVQNRMRVFHRITARGVGTSDTAVVKLQSTYVKAYE